MSLCTYIDIETKRSEKNKRGAQSRCNNLVVIVLKMNTWDYGVQQLPPTLYNIIMILLFPLLLAVLWIRIGFKGDPNPAFQVNADPDPWF